MFGLFRSDPCKKLEKQLQQKYQQSIQLQRNGNLREYGKMMKEIEELENELIRLKEKK